MTSGIAPIRNQSRNGGARFLIEEGPGVQSPDISLDGEGPERREQKKDGQAQRRTGKKTKSGL